MLLNYEATYSITKPFEAEQVISFIIRNINDYLKKDSFNTVITDGTSGVGGDVINFAKYFKRVNAVEIDISSFDLLVKNIDKRRNVVLHNDDYTKIWSELNQEVIYLDPPWGGRSYKKKKEVFLELSGIPLHEFIKRITNFFKDILIFIKIPINANVDNINIREQSYISNKLGRTTFKIIFVS